MKEKATMSPDFPIWEIDMAEMFSEKQKTNLMFLTNESRSNRVVSQQSSMDFFECNSAMDYVGALISLVYNLDNRNQHQIEPFMEKAARAAHFNRYENNWKVVRDILETRPVSLYHWLNVLPKYFSPQEFYGNLIPVIRKMNRSLRYRSWHHRPTARVVWPQRKRGYNDQGHHTPSHEKLLSKDDSTRLSQLQRLLEEKIGEQPKLYRPPQSHLLDKRLERNSFFKELSSLHDDHNKIKEELENEQKAKRAIKRRIKRVREQLRRATERDPEENQELKESGRKSS